MLKVVRINFISGRWWLQPSQWTISRTQWAPRVYTNLKKLLTVEGLLKENVIISLNKDKDLSTYRSLQQMRDLRIFLTNAEVAKIEAGTPLDYKLPRRKMVLRFDKKSLKHLKDGYIPFVFADYLWDNRNKSANFAYHVLVWRKTGFVDISKSVDKDKSLAIANVPKAAEIDSALDGTVEKTA